MNVAPASTMKDRHKKTARIRAVFRKFCDPFYLNLLGDFLSHSMMMGLATNIEE
jgi:hypothetical protein